ncbi:mitochondrial ribosomal protein subunit-domain-containing protein [Phyllosticta citricarpa]|uniref:Mitochondrial ribosomal protein subunit-domain-containing protein n=2 Tax=Phyllosticta TaxID=121621 RepID=A0ABR1M611_9PEZI
MVRAPIGGSAKTNGHFQPQLHCRNSQSTSPIAAGHHAVAPSSTMSKRMARKLSSPTANLLRNSRLFSLPPPIPPPFEGDGAFEASVGSDTATQAFPTYQAIATPASSLHRGDWGMKRPLPMRETTRSTAPAMRVFEVDTINFITDFESAGDHVRTLEKWQQLNMPLSSGSNVGASSTHQHVSVFNEREDNTYLDADMRSKGHGKWKYDGPWVGEMTTGEFEKFLKTKVKGAKQGQRNQPSFGEVLHKKITEMVLAQRKEEARAEGAEPPEEDGFEISEQEYELRLKMLREDTTLSSPLSQWIIQYFDMPDLREETLNPKLKTTLGGQNVVDQLDGKMMSKPRTHPSAGLSYLRTRSFLENHPILGPRDDYAPVKARLLSPTIGTNKETKVGVAGVVADLERSSSASTFDSRYSFDEPGGHKLWVTLKHARINANGRIQLQASHENEYKVAAYKGESFDEAEKFTKKARRSDQLPEPSMPVIDQQMPKAEDSHSKDELINVVQPVRQ